MVTAAPSFENPATYSLAKGFPVVAPPVDSSLRLDLEAMLDKSVGAGLVYVCNPNNPTGTVYGASVVRDFVSQVLARSPRTTVLIDEAYHEYVDDPTYATAIPLALTEPRVLVLRTFSKVHGMAGLRVGYAIARPETIRAMAPFQLQVNVNILGAAAAKASLGATAHIERERKLNREARVYTQAFFEKAGYTVCRSETNFVMVEIRRPIEEFKKACADRGVAIGRPFPPLLTHARISIGTMEEMKKAVEAFAHVLGL
jgi:histidinol-phosphate aminotransferase